MEEPALSVAIDQARADIARIDRVPLDRIALPSDSELADCGEQVWRLKLFFSRFRRFGAIEFFPKFPGCGIIDASIGDVFVHEHLFEVKAGDRRFLSVDLKQLITYAALNSLEGAREIKYLGLFNPRVGISYTVALEQLCQEISGTSATELLAEIVRVISSGEISK
jgi:hypothetical protein